AGLCVSVIALVGLQLSLTVTPPSTSGTAAWQFASALALGVVEQVTTGAVVSVTVTVAVQVWVLPLLSVTVRVTRLVPMLAQLKLGWLRLRLAMPQASLLPLSIWAGVIVTLPVGSNWTVMSWQRAIGGVVSDTVTTCWQEFVHPVSDTVTVRVKLPDAPAFTV